MMTDFAGKHMFSHTYSTKPATVHMDAVLVLSFTDDH